MAIIECKECAAKISDAAKSCPSCGNPMARVVTIEQTSKRFKLLQVVAVFFLLGGVVACTGESPQGSAIMWMIGVSLYIYSRIGAWWRNG